VTAAKASPRARVEAAARDVASARARFTRDIAPLRAAFGRHRNAWIIGGGLASGVATAFLPPRFVSGIGALFGGTTALVARSLVAPMLSGALAARQRLADAGAPVP